MMMRVSLCCVLLLFQPVIASEDIKAKLVPNDVIVLEGEPLIMNCTLTTNSSLFTSNDLYFHFQSERISEQFVTRLNERTKQLNMTATYDMTGSHMFCYAEGYVDDEGTRKTLDHQVLTVIRRPLKPNITGCIVENWEKLTCSWKPSAAVQSNYTGLNVTQELFWILRKLPGAYRLYKRLNVHHPCIGTTSCDKHLNRCPHPSPGRCVWKVPDPDVLNNHFRRDEDYAMFVTTNLSTPRGEHWIFDSVPQIMETKYLVKPDPPDELIADVDDWNFTLAWTTPTQAIGRPLIQNITVQVFTDSHQIDPEIPSINLTWNGRMDSTIPKIVFVGGDNYTHNGHLIIRPYTGYRCTIKSIPYFKDVDGARGFWSDEKSIIITTSQSVPGDTPHLTNGHFLLEETSAETVAITIYWNRIPRMFEHGKMVAVLVHYVPDHESYKRRRDTSYGLTSCDCPSHSCVSVPYTAGVGHARLNLLQRDRNYRIYVEGKNEMGCNPSLLDSMRSDVIVSKHSKLIKQPEEFVVRYNKSAEYLHLTWQHADENDPPNNYTLYWCKARNPDKFMECESELEWKTLSGDQTEYFMRHMPDDVQYEFALSADDMKYFNGPTSSGLLFMRCIYDMAIGITPPAEFRYAPKEQQQGGTMKLIWNLPDRCKHAAYIESYEISYWLASDNTQRDVKMKTVSATTKECIIDKVKTEETYKVSIRSVSKWQQSHPLELEKTYTVTKIVEGITPTAKMVLWIVGVICFLLFCVGAFSIFRGCRKKYRKMAEGPNIILPEDNIATPRHNEYTADPVDGVITILPDEDITVMDENCVYDPYCPEIETKKPLLNSNSNVQNGVRGMKVFYTTAHPDSAVGSSVPATPEAELISQLQDPNDVSKAKTLQPGTDAELYTTEDCSALDTSGVVLPSLDASAVKDTDTYSSVNGTIAPQVKDTGSLIASSGSGITPYSVLKNPVHITDKQSTENTPEIERTNEEGVLSEPLLPAGSQPPSAAEPVGSADTPQVNSAGYVVTPTPITVSPSSKHGTPPLHSKGQPPGSQPLHSEEQKAGSDKNPNGSNAVLLDNNSNHTDVKNIDDVTQTESSTQPSQPELCDTNLPSPQTSSLSEKNTSEFNVPMVDQSGDKLGSRDSDMCLKQNNIAPDCDTFTSAVKDDFNLDLLTTGDASKNTFPEENEESNVKHSYMVPNGVGDKNNAVCSNSLLTGDSTHEKAADIDGLPNSEHNKVPPPHPSAYAPQFVQAKPEPSGVAGYVTHDQFVPV